MTKFLINYKKSQDIEDKKRRYKRGDIVTLSLPSIPESLYLMYALNSLVAIFNFIHPNSSSEDFLRLINEVDTKIFFSVEKSLKIVNI